METKNKYWVIVENVDGVNRYVCHGDNGVAIGNGVNRHYDTPEARAADWPECGEIIAKALCDTALTQIDLKSRLNINDMHLIKAGEAERIKFDGVTDPLRVPYTHAEHVKTGKSLAELAEIFWEKHSANAPHEANRTAAKRTARNS